MSQFSLMVYYTDLRSLLEVNASDLTPGYTGLIFCTQIVVSTGCANIMYSGVYVAGLSRHYSYQTNKHTGCVNADCGQKTLPFLSGGTYA